MGWLMPSGSQLESTIATTGIFSLRASAMAIDSLLVSMTNIRSGSAPMSLMPPSERSSLSFSRVSWSSSFLVRPCVSPCEQLLERLEPLDRVGDGPPIGQRAAEPAVIDVILRAGLGGIGDRLRRLPLGADEQHAAAFGDDVGDRKQRLMQERTVWVRSMMWMLLREP